MDFFFTTRTKKRSQPYVVCNPFYAKHNDYMTKVQEAKKRLRKLFELRTELDEHQERLSAKMIAIDKTSAIGSLFGEISDYDE